MIRVENDTPLIIESLTPAEDRLRDRLTQRTVNQVLTEHLIARSEVDRDSVERSAGLWLNHFFVSGHIQACATDLRLTETETHRAALNSWRAINIWLDKAERARNG